MPTERGPRRDARSRWHHRHHQSLDYSNWPADDWVRPRGTLDSRARALRRLTVTLAAALVPLVLVLGPCSGRGVSPRPPEEIRDGPAPGLEVLSFGTLSAYLIDDPLVVRPGIGIALIARDHADRWWSFAAYHSIRPTGGGSSSEFPLLLSEPYPHKALNLRTNHNGVLRRHVQAPETGQYLACAFYTERQVAGCDPVTIGAATRLYVYFGDDRAHLDTGDGAAAAAYEQLGCRHQRRQGQRHPGLAHLGAGYRCVNW